MAGQLEPKSELLGPHRSVVPNDVVGHRKPERRCLEVARQQRRRDLRLHHQVVLDQVLRFYRVLDEDAMAHLVVVHIVPYHEMMHSVDRGASIEGLVDSTPFNIRSNHPADHVEVDRVPPHLERLSSKGNLYIRELALDLPLLAPHHDMGAVLGRACVAIPPEDDVSRQEPDLAPDVESLPVVGEHLSEMLILQRLLDGDDCSGHANDLHDVELVLVGPRRREDDRLPGLPVDVLDQGDRGGAGIDGARKLRPHGRPHLPIHADLASLHRNDLVAQSGQRGVALTPMHSDYQLVLASRALRTHVELAASNHDVVRIEGLRLGIVEFHTSLNKEGLHVHLIDIHKQDLPLWHVYDLTLNRRHLASPGVAIAPPVNIPETDRRCNDNARYTFDTQAFRIERAARSSRAHDLCRRLRVDHATYIIDEDRRRAVECPGDGDLGAARGRADRGSHTRRLEGLVLPILHLISEYLIGGRVVDITHNTRKAGLIA